MDVKIQGITVHFPYKPYGCQMSMLNRVVTALNNKQGCLLESPTGTGKTLALLCATLGWIQSKTEHNLKSLESEKENVCISCSVSSEVLNPDGDFGDFIEDEIKPAAAKSVECTCSSEKLIEEVIPRVFYGTRTHKQIAQIVRELRKTKYTNTRMCILSSRKHTCINPDIKRSSNIAEACQNLNGSCQYDQPRRKSDLTRCIHTLNTSGGWDLEDYVDQMSRVPSCPYFQAFKLMESAQLIFCPYNYLLDPVFRNSVSADLKGSVIILDEAHNIEDAAREATSCTLLERDLLTAQEDLKRYLNSMGGREEKDVNALLTLLDSVHQVMQLTRSRLVLAGDFANSSQVWTGPEIEGLLKTVGLASDKFTAVQSNFTRLNNRLQKETGSLMAVADNSSNKTVPSSATMHFFEYIFTMLIFLYDDSMHRMGDYRAVLTEVTDYQRMHAGEEKSNPVSNNSQWFGKAAKTRLVESRTLSLNFWCLNPAVCMTSLASVAHCLILASGTLSPLDALAAELDLDFPVRLEASHVVPPERVFAASLSRGPGGTKIQATYANQNSFTFQDDVGGLILEACKIVPGGVLVFFPSYGLLEKLVTRWEMTGLLDKLSRVKHVLQEPRSSQEFDAWMSDFYEAVDSTRVNRDQTDVQAERPKVSQTGACALAVCRGKVSEGLDFADDYGRLVIAVGIPFPAFKNPQVEQKRLFNDNLRANATASSLVSWPAPTSNGSPTPILKNTSVLGSPRPVLISPLSPPPDAATVRRPRRVLSGSEWYEAQAYRALNQALGRCIRHRNDWGAIILADVRFAEQPARYLSGISRWLRTRFVAHHSWNDLAERMSAFVRATDV